MIRAKVECMWNDPYDNETNELRFSAVLDDSCEENKFFSAYTPYLEIQTSMKAEVAELFEVGKQYYLDFKEVE